MIKMKKSTHKVVFFSALPPYRGGISDFSELVVSAMEQQYDLKAFTFKKQYPNFLFPGKTQLSLNKLSKSYPRIVSGFNPLSYFSAVRQLKKSSPTIFITNYWMTFFAPMNVFFSKSFKKDCLKIAIIHNLIPHEKRFFDTFFNRIFVKSYDGFIVLSESVKKDLLAIDPAAKYCLLKHPSYNQFGEKIARKEAAEALGLDPTKKILLFFGLIRNYKGLDLLLQAFSNLNKEFILLIAGEVYGDEITYTNLIAKSKNKNIHFVNQFINEQDVKLYFSVADLCVLPYKSATQSGIQALANSFCLPVLISNVGGLVEDIVDEKNGFILNEINPLAIQNKIEEIFNENKLTQVEENLKIENLLLNDMWTKFSDSLIQFCDTLKKNS
ncbi:MAG: glycosyltransferase [Flavobacteriales bacterium]|nr:glycosyltransferase [Flavobacteriales bacterium]NDA97612.1 glycosyltransferase [Flavobacteriia bacterium]NDC28881.1 glycosyltransferase [Crocinitomicaceae bacterium]NDC92176.1 glycosyltransferase [Flavobacteriales bacterium]